ncbi:cyclin-D3-1-like isoform X1 [Musa acuminata AAA Group]|uniref:cyclin-D3-1-like isoform X1 n=1 Tax=Musa acuminata AAA Group TaxID=214697 RepID=UPI0031DE83ED
MAPTFDSAASTLFCAEDNISVLGLDEEGEGGHGLGWVSEVESSDFYGDFLVDFPVQSDECVGLLVGRETEHMPREDYAVRLRSGALDLAIRRDATDWIWKQGKAWMSQLLSVACLSLAAKMEETEVPLSLDLQVGDVKYIFEARTIQRMEQLVLSTLKWRMQAVTPFSFIDFFLHKFNGGNAPSKLLVSRSVELILGTIRGIEFLAFRPSELAAAVSLSVLRETQNVEAEKALSCCVHVVKEGVFRCYEMIQELMAVRGRSLEIASPLASYVPQSPNGVLDAACLSYKSDDTSAGSQATCHQDSPANKRRKTSSLPIP